MQFKTDWKYNDIFDLDSDYIRIKSNIEKTKALAKTLYNRVSAPKLNNYLQSDLPYAEFFNNIEQSLQSIADYTFRRQSMERGKVYIANGAIFTYEDLNRIERDLSTIYNDLLSAKENRQRMKLTLGGIVLGGVSFG